MAPRSDSEAYERRI
jgi:predicted RNase H-like nuclease (RuvC/YqgF family)